MRYVFTSILVVFFFHAYAGDTLTRAQVYSFYNVGDTFDYRTYSASAYSGGGGGPAYDYITISYSRYIISNIYWSADTLIKFIVREKAFPSPQAFDTIVLTALQSYEVFLDTPFGFSSSQSLIDQVIVDTSPVFWGRSTNFLQYQNVYPPQDSFYLFANGLGAIVFGDVGGAHCCFTGTDTITLIYYSGDSGKYGMPYTLFHDTAYNVDGLSDIPSANKNVKLYPTLNNGIFTIVTQDQAQLPFDLSIYDIEGRRVSQLLISDQRKVIEQPDLSTGLYIWKASNSESAFSVGKMIIQK